MNCDHDRAARDLAILFGGGVGGHRCVILRRDRLAQVVEFLAHEHQARVDVDLSTRRHLAVDDVVETKADHRSTAKRACAHRFSIFSPLCGGHSNEGQEHRTATAVPKHTCDRCGKRAHAVWTRPAGKLCSVCVKETEPRGRP